MTREAGASRIMSRNYAHCDACGRVEHIDSLDGKPSPYPRTLRGWHRRFLDWWYGNESRDFDRLECRDCYGPGYVDGRTPTALDGEGV